MLDLTVVRVRDVKYAKVGVSHSEDLIYPCLSCHSSGEPSQELLHVSQQLYDGQHRLSPFCYSELLLFQHQADISGPVSNEQDAMQTRLPKCLQ